MIPVVAGAGSPSDQLPALRAQPHLVDAGRSLPIDNAHQVPGVPNEIHL